MEQTSAGLDATTLVLSPGSWRCMGDAGIWFTWLLSQAWNLTDEVLSVNSLLLLGNQPHRREDAVD